MSVIHAILEQIETKLKMGETVINGYRLDKRWFQNVYNFEIGVWGFQKKFNTGWKYRLKVLILEGRISFSYNILLRRSTMFLAILRS